MTKSEVKVHLPYLLSSITFINWKTALKSRFGIPVHGHEGTDLP